MSRWLLTPLTLSALAVAVVLAIAHPGALSHNGPFAQSVAAVATPWAYIDKIDNGAGWCDPNNIDNTSTEYVGESHQFALCVGNLTHPVHSFQATIGYNGTLDQCIDKVCPLVTLGAQTFLDGDEGCVDGNPDANTGVTFWGDDGLGTGWNCVFTFASGSGLANPGGEGPTCNAPDQGSSQLSAEISCHGTNSYTLGDDETWGALAVINMNVIAAGVDNVDIQSLQVSDAEEPIIVCSPMNDGADVNGVSGVERPCQGASDIKLEKRRRPTSTPSPKPTATPKEATPTAPPPPPAAPTPFGGAGPAIVAPITGSGPAGSDAPWALWLAAGVAGAALAAGGFYVRYARSDR